MRGIGSTGVNRRQALLQGLGSALLGGTANAGGLDPEARLSGEFEPQERVWLGYDAGHREFSAALARALHPHVKLGLLVRDADSEAAARELLADAGLGSTVVPAVHDPHAPFFVRDAALFAANGSGAAALVDLRWTHYGWQAWCRRRHRGQAAAMAACKVVAEGGIEGLEPRLADALARPVIDAGLAMEGGGIECNGRGLLLANQAQWLDRNPGLSRAEIERRLKAWPGVRKVIWLPQGLAQDPLHRSLIVGRHVGWGTGGHTDEFVRFADERTVLLAWPDEAEAARHPVSRLNRQRMQRCREVLQAGSDARGRRLRVLELPLPRIVERPVYLSAAADAAYSDQWSAEMFPVEQRLRQGDRVIQVAAASTLNFVIANGVVVAPDYRPHGTPPALHERIERVLRQAFAGRSIAWIDAIGANWLGGGAHCATLSEPASA